MPTLEFAPELARPGLPAAPVAAALDGLDPALSALVPTPRLAARSSMGWRAPEIEAD